ncbi:hypothetical protein AURDEDRAFT_174200 [Auricularia subglabra TFB-10046 SS5]|nr:hypothetical protein AURDEDRAFT_174200 [Auricularia subglabra TFB-10046 SS5]
MSAGHNASNAFQRFPPEILALCFTFLPLRCRVIASHVSRVWRAIALDTPSVWATINHPNRDRAPSAAIMRMALSRSATLPIHFAYFDTVREDVANVLQSSMHRIEYLALILCNSTSFIRCPAPLLRCLYLMSGIKVTADFLGNSVGRLTELHTTTLRVLAPCLSLSTLITLTAVRCEEGALRLLFASCPCLKVLSITDLVHSSVGAALLYTPPPPLTDLILKSNDSQCDIVSIYAVCRAATHLDHADLAISVGLGRPPRSRKVDIAPVLYGAEHIRVDVSFHEDRIVVAARSSSTQRHSISLKNLIADHFYATQQPFPSIFKLDAACLTQLRTLTVPISALAAVVADAPAFPTGVQLCIEIAPLMHVRPSVVSEEPTPCYPWPLLRALTDVEIEHVVLHVVQADELSASDGQVMLAELAVAAPRLHITDGVDFAPLQSWSGEWIPHLTLIGAQSLYYPMSQFLASSSGLISLHLSPRVHPGRLKNSLGIFAGKIAHMTACIEHLGAFFNARLDAPQLVSLELRLTGVTDDSLPVNASEFYYIRAPLLRDLTLDLSGSDDDVEAHADYISGVLQTLRDNFRSLIVYDADLLECVTVRYTSPAAENMDLSCFARFSQQYIADK